MMEFIKDLIVVGMGFIKDLTVIVGLCVLIYNIGAWRREHVGKRKIELAEDALALFYEAKDVISWIRSSFGFEGETDEIKQKPSEQNEEFEARKNASVVFVRYNQNKELFSKIHALRYRFMAQMGREATKPFEDLNKIMKDIILSARQLARRWPEKHFKTGEEKEKNRKRIKEAEAIFWEGIEGKDPINPKVEKVIADLEKICQPIIMAGGTLHSFLNKKR